MDVLTDVIKVILYFFGIIFCWIGVITVINKVKTDSSLPVEEIDKVDSLVAVNDSITIVVNNLDSIKNAKVIEIKGLNNDSTLSLFYKLLSE